MRRRHRLFTALLLAMSCLPAPAEAQRSAARRSANGILATVGLSYFDSDTRAQQLSAQVRSFRNAAERYLTEFRRARAELAHTVSLRNTDRRRIAELEAEVARLGDLLKAAEELLAVAHGQNDPQFARNVREIERAAESFLETEQGRYILNLIASGTPQNLIQASNLILGPEGGAPAWTPAGARDRALLLTSIRGQGTATTTNIIRLLRQAVEGGQATGSDLMWLSTLYRETQNFPEAQRFAEQAVAGAHTQTERAEALNVLGRVQHDREINQGAQAGSTHSFEQSEALFRQMATTGTIEERRDSRARLVSALVSQTDTALDSHDFPAALVRANEAFSIADALSREEATNRYYVELVPITRLRRAEVYAGQRDYPRARAEYEQALQVAERLLAGAPPADVARLQFTVSSAQRNLAGVLYAQRDFPGAAGRYAEARRLALILVTPDSENVHYASCLLSAQSGLALSLIALDRISEAIVLLRDNIARAQVVVRGRNASAFCECILSEGYLKLGEILLEEGDVEGARSNFLAGLEVAERRQNLDVGNRNYHSLAARALYYLAALSQPGYSWQRALRQFERLRRDGPLSALESQMADVAARQGGSSNR